MIAVDAMGGDNAPEVVVQGAFQAAKEWGIDITFVGDRNAIEATLRDEEDMGAAVIVSLRTFVGTYTEYWTLVLGIILILLIFFLPDGIMGYNFIEKFRLRAKRKSAGSLQ